MSTIQSPLAIRQHLGSKLTLAHQPTHSVINYRASSSPRDVPYIYNYIPTPTYMYYLLFLDPIEVELAWIKRLYQTLHVSWSPPMTESLWIILHIYNHNTNIHTYVERHTHTPDACMY